MERTAFDKKHISKLESSCSGPVESVESESESEAEVEVDSQAGTESGSHPAAPSPFPWPPRTESI